MSQLQGLDGMGHSGEDGLTCKNYQTRTFCTAGLCNWEICPKTLFNGFGIRKTIEWYISEQVLVHGVINSEYQSWIKEQYTASDMLKK